MLNEECKPLKKSTEIPNIEKYYALIGFAYFCTINFRFLALYSAFVHCGIMEIWELNFYNNIWFVLNLDTQRSIQKFYLPNHYWPDQKQILVRDVICR